MSDSLLALTVARRESLTSEIERFDLTAAPGQVLPGFTPGAHISVQTPCGAMRRYSIISNPADKSAYSIAVKREQNGRGGSVSMHQQAQVNDRILVEAPANEFELVDSPAYLFIAGGIGITPIWSMVQALQRLAQQQSAEQFAGQFKTADWHLVYCTRSARQTAFLTELTDPSIADRVTIHHDNGQADAAFDFWPLLETPDNRHIYCCGPQPLMDDIADMTGHWPVRAIHTESFSPVQAVREDDQPFVVRIAGQSAALHVAADQSLLQALRAAGHEMRSSCESGTCGTCKLGYRGSGQIDHRDLFLMPEEKHNCLMACVSRVVDGDIELVIYP
ncbi:MAG: PDR/VanB family oxidoreductase [Burkholderiaceae bacterium]